MNLCKGCRFAKDRFRESCFCVQYGIIITYGKKTCKGYKPLRKQDIKGANENEQADYYREPGA